MEVQPATELSIHNAAYSPIVHPSTPTMPAVQPGSTILVTGASGFIAAHVVEHLLNAGFNVRGTVRSDGKGQYLEKLFKDNKGGKFEYVLVEDITKVGDLRKGLTTAWSL